jgi:prevent-host-death family protein
MKIANIHEAKTQLSKLIEAALTGEDVVISKAGVPVVKIIPYEVAHEPRKPGYWRSRVKIAEDFDSLPDFLLKGFMGEEE